jgi:hypothetical protein
MHIYYIYTKVRYRARVSISTQDILEFTILIEAFLFYIGVHFVVSTALSVLEDRSPEINIFVNLNTKTLRTKF